ncbi:MAG: transporter substrate-binding domain-containing protein [Treponema sp.]|nr:transporter substrate-binding domain-containing protein [Treponema sp.]
MGSKKIVGVLVLLGVFCTALFAGGTKEGGAAGKTLLEQIKAKGELSMGTASGYPPYEFVDITSPTQEVVGVDVALGQRIADALGVKLKVSDMTFGALLSSLPAKKIDVAIAGINPTDERKKTVDFSDTYLTAEQRLMIRKSDAGTLTKLEDFYGKKVAAEKSSTQEALAQEEIRDVQLIALERVPDCVLELLSNKIDGIVVEDTVAQQYILSNSELTFSDAVFVNKNKFSAIALEKGNEDLLAVINKVIADSIADGSIDRWVTEYSLKVLENSR